MCVCKARISKRKFSVVKNDKDVIFYGAYNNEIRWREMERRENARILEESVAEATQQGEHNAMIETARGMLSDGLPTESVVKYTGLPLAEVQQLALSN